MSDTSIHELEDRLAAIERALQRLQGEDGVEQLEACRALLTDVPADAALAVASEDGLGLAGLGHRPVTTFGDGRPRHSAAALAQLEALRAGGILFLLIPERHRSWLGDLPAFAEHLAKYDVVIDRPGVGMLVDLRRPAAERTVGLAELVDSLLGGRRYAPVLDWTGLDVGALLTGPNVFKTSTADAVLPYLDSTVDVVLIDDPRRLEESGRIAKRAVVQVTAEGAGGVRVTAVQRLAMSKTDDVGSTVMAALGRESGDPWLTRLEESVGEHSSTTVVAGEELAAADVGDADVLVLVEPSVLPLPGSVAALRATLDDETIGAVAVKLLDREGSLEAAGATVFADGSVEGIGHGLADVSASWHEYLRPVCSGSGLLAVRPALVGGPLESFAAIAARAWEGGLRVVYQPDAWAVRTSPETDAAPSAEGWDAVLASRPRRPLSLDTASWMALVARDDPEASWR